MSLRNQPTFKPMMSPSSHTSLKDKERRATQLNPSQIAPASALQPHPEVKDELEERSEKQVPISAPTKKLHLSKGDPYGGPGSGESESEGHDNDNLPPPPCRTPDYSSSKQTLSKIKSVDNLEDIFEAYRQSQKRKEAPFTTEAEDGGTAKKSKLFQRVFTVKDEAALLKAVILFKKKNGHEPVSSAEFDALHDAVKVHLPVDCSMTQTRRKFNHIKDRYLKQIRKENEGNGKRKGKEPKLISDPDEQTVFELAGQIWGEGKIVQVVECEDEKTPITIPTVNNDNCASLAPDPITYVSKYADDDDEDVIINFIANEFKYMSYRTVKNKLATMSSVDREELDDIWSDFQEKEMEFQQHRLETAKRIVNKLKGKKKMAG